MKKFMWLVVLAIILPGCAIEGSHYVTRDPVTGRWVDLPPSYSPQYAQYQYTYNNGYSYDVPQCSDPDSGGHASCAELANRHRLPYEQGYYVRHITPCCLQSVAPVVVGYPANMWERPERRHQKRYEEKVDSKPAPGPTVDDYMSPVWSNVIPDDCRKGNFGHDSVCLYREATKLDQKQSDCEKDGNKCNPLLNFGKMAKQDRELAAKLRQAQDN